MATNGTNGANGRTLRSHQKNYPTIVVDRRLVYIELI